MPLTAVQFAQRHNVSVNTVKNWLARGLLPGSVMAKDHDNHGVWSWFIPDDAKAPNLRSGRPSGERVTIAPAEPKTGPIGSPDDPLAYMKANHKTMSIRHFSQAFGVSAAEVRQMYDALHAEGAFDDEP